MEFLRTTAGRIVYCWSVGAARPLATISPRWLCLILYDRAPRRYNGFSGPSLQKQEAAMFTFTAGILLAILLVFVVIPLIVVASVRLFLSILDYSRKVPPHTLRRIH